MAVSGHNGNNETFIGMSSSIDLSFFDENMNKIEIADTKKSIDIIIQRDPNIPEYPFQYVNTSQLKLSSSFVPNAFNLTSKNASIHIEIKPVNLSIGYLVVMKLGHTPIINSSFVDFNSFRIFCPSKKYPNFNLDVYF